MVFNPCGTINEVCVDKQRGYECVCRAGFHKKSGSSACTGILETFFKNLEIYSTNDDRSDKMAHGLINQ